MKTWMRVTATKFFDRENVSYGYLYVSSEDVNVHVKLSYAEAQAQLLKLSRKLGKAPEMLNNQYNPMITTREVYGYIDRE